MEEKFTRDFQLKVLYLLFNDKALMIRARTAIQYDTFDEDISIVVKYLYKYFDRYHNTPNSFHSLVDFIIPLYKQKIVTKEEISIIKQTLSKLKNKANDIAWLSDIESIKETIFQFAKVKYIEKTILKGFDLINKGKTEDVLSMLENLKMFDTNIDIPIPQNIYAEEYNPDKDERKTTSLPWPILNNITGGGLGPGELGIFASPSGSGKTWTLINIANHAAKLGKNVLYINLETDKFYLKKRFISNLLEIPLDQLKNRKEEVNQKLKSYSKLNVRLEDFSSNSISTLDIEFIIEQIQLLENEKVDLLIVDYADLLKPAKTNKWIEKEYQALTYIYRDLINIGKKFQIPVWTVSQVKREGFKEEWISEDKLASSIGKFTDSFFVATIQRGEENTLRINIIKNRFGPDKLKLYGYYDYSMGKILMFDEESKLSNYLIQISQNKQFQSNFEPISDDLIPESNFDDDNIINADFWE